MNPVDHDSTQSAQPAADAFSPAGLLRQFRAGIQRSHLLRLAEQTPVNAFTTITVSLALAGFVYLDTHSPWLLLWVGAQTGLATLVYLRWRKRAVRTGPFPTYGRSRRGLKLATFWAGLSGLMWGSMVAFLPLVSPRGEVAILLALGGIAAGASRTLATVPSVAIAYVLGCGLPMIAYFSVANEPLDRFIALAILVYMVSMLYSARNVYRTMLRLLRAESQSEYYRDVHLRQTIESLADEQTIVAQALHTGMGEICEQLGIPAAQVFLADADELLHSTDLWYQGDTLDLRQIRRRSEDLKQSGKRFARTGSGTPERLLWLTLERLRDAQAGDIEAVWVDKDRLAALADAGVAALALMPICAAGRCVALLEFLSRESAEPAQRDRDFLESLGAQLSMALERRATGARLRESEKQARRAADRAQDFLEIAGSIIYALDRDEKITLFNQAGYRLLECGESEVIGHNWFDRFVPEDEREYRRQRFHNVMCGATRLPQGAIEHRLLSLRGTERRVLLATELLTNDQGHVIGSIGSAIDITEQRRVEEQLLQAQKMEAIGQLTSGIAHDFNNLLMVARGNIEMLGLDAELSEKTRRMHANSLAALDRATVLTSKLLSFSRKGMLLPEVLDLSAVVTSMMELLERSLGDNITTQLTITEQLWAVKADKSQIENSLLNLAINARDAMSGSGELHISLGNVALDEDAARAMDIQGGDYVTISVEDTGIGIAPQLRQRVLEPFFTTKSDKSGTGLGLTMVYGTARQADGTVSISSEPGSGTEVRMYLPRAAGTVPAAISVDPDATGTILVVDDDQALLDLTVSMLNNLGFKTLAVTSAEQAFAIVANNSSINLLLTDIMLGGGWNGYQLAENVLSDYPQVPIVCMSGFAGVLPTSPELEALPRLNKPFRTKQLAQIVRETLQSAAQRP